MKGWRLALVLLLAGGGASAQPAAAPDKPDPEELRARERMVILDIRTLLTAAKQYAAKNGFVDEIRCLGQPRQCLPDYPEDAPSFVDPSYDFLRSRLGYLRKFHAGPRPSAAEIERARASPSSLRSFAYTAVPEKPGETGYRAFCGDSTGRLCSTSDGSEPPVKEGRCDKSCRSLQ